MKKTLLVGLDAACWEYLDPLLAAGRLPTLERLMAGSAWGRLLSTMPAQTPAAWSSIVTGKNPGKHGIADFLVRRPGTYEFLPASSQLRVGTPFWKRLNDQGIKVGLVNVPFTYPIEPPDGFVVCGFGTPGSARDFVYPAAELGRLEARTGHFEPVVDPKILKKGSPEEIFHAERQHQTHLVDAAIDLAARYQVQVLVINLLLPDHANHKLPDMAQVQQAICASDEDLARLLDGFQPDNVLLISDHGSRRVKGDFLLHVWLRDHGYCVQADRTPAEQAATMNWLLKRWFQNRNGWSGIAEKALRGASRNLALRFPDSLARPVWSQLEQIAPFARQQVLLSPEIDLSKSPLLLGSSYSGLLHLNIQGRDPSGVIGNRERSAFVAELVSKLAGISDPFSGEPLFSAVHTADQLYDGPASQYAPELILDSYDSPWNTLATFRRGFFGEQIRHRFFADNHKDFGHHSREGIFVFSGVDLASNGRSPRKGSVMDVPATLLYLCGVPIPEDYDGQALLELIDPRFVERNPLQRQPGDDPGQAAFDKTYSTEEADLLIQHLQALGYLE